MTNHPNRSKTECAQRRRNMLLWALTCDVHQSEMDYAGQQIHAEASRLYDRDAAFRREVDKINSTRKEAWERERLEAGLLPR